MLEVVEDVKVTKMVPSHIQKVLHKMLCFLVVCIVFGLRVLYFSFGSSIVGYVHKDDTMLDSRLKPPV